MKHIIYFLAVVGLLGTMGFTALVLLALVLPDVEPEPQYADNITGYEMFEAINDHRVSVGLNALPLHDQLCNNLIGRWKEIKSDFGHDGMNDWAENYVWNHNNRWYLSELIVEGWDVQSSMDNWLGSPGHRLGLESTEMTHMCTFVQWNEESEYYLTLLIMGYLR
jgi:uncharacterized protein YkwD